MERSMVLHKMLGQILEVVDHVRGQGGSNCQVLDSFSGDKKSCPQAELNTFKFRCLDAT